MRHKQAEKNDGPVKQRGPLRFTAVYMALLFGITIWILLDQFVIVRAIAPVELAQPTPRATQAILVTPQPTAAPAGEAEPTAASEPTATPEPALTEPQVDLSEIRIYDTDVHIADIRIPDASYLQTAMANNTYGRNIKQTVSEMAAANDALIAINGDYFGFRTSGYVIRNSVLYRRNVQSRQQPDLCIWPDGNMTVILEGMVSSEELAAQGVREVFSFGPALVQDGQITVDENMEVDTYITSNPRTVLCMVEPLHYLFIVSDGRTTENKGVSLYQLAELAQSLGAQVAYNLDGGGTSTMVYEGKIINFPSARGYWEERKVSDIVYIKR